MALLRAAAELLFPPVCQVCKVRGEYPLCLACLYRFPVIRAPVCSTCGRPLAGMARASMSPSCCRRQRYFAAARAAGLYEDPLRTAVHALKFHGCRRMAEPLGWLMATAADLGQVVSAADLLVPIPLHPRRYHERGFNQSELLARVIGDRLGLPVRTDVVRRRRDTAPQSGLTADGRRTNVRGAFEAIRPVPLAGVLLVDDVMSTGSTASECARVLCEGGARCVMVLAAALSLPPEAGITPVRPTG